jgi:flagellar hook protein FlgE
MGLNSALFSSVSGLNTTSTAITVVGDNIANVNTPGFKQRRAEFADVLGQSISGVGGFSQLGAGSKVQRVSTLYSQGTFESSGRVTDLAIEGQGFFVLEGSKGTFMTRAGIFNFDNEGFFVNREGLRVQGYGIDPQTGLSNGQIGDIEVSSSIAPPRDTTAMEMSVNLDANAPILGAAGATFDPTDPNTTSNFRTVLTVYDSLGNEHAATVFFSKVEENTWDINVAVAAAETDDVPDEAGDPFIVQGGGNTVMTFDDQGVLTAPVGTTTITFNFNGGAATGQDVLLSFGNLAASGSSVDPTTQFAADSTTNSFLQDGFAPGNLQGTIIDSEGFITGQFSNGELIPLAQLALATFANVEALTNVGNNRLVESRHSGQAVIGAAETGTFGSVRSSTLEQSNVDLATEFVRLIINQRAFQANTRTISVTNELLATLNQLGQ